MPQGVQHRIVCVGLAAEVFASLTPLLRARGGEPAASCPDLASAREDAGAYPAESHLFIVHVAPDLDLARLAALPVSFPGQPVLALLPGGTDIPRVLAAQRAGASQVVTLPLREADFLQALDCLIVQFAPPPQAAHVVAVCGVSGGAGATTLALNLASEIAQASGARRNVLLVELARGMGTLATYLDIAPELTTHDLVRDAGHLSTAGVRRAVAHVSPGLDVLVGPYEEITPGATSSRNVFQLIELCRKLASVVVLDVPCTLDDLQFETLTLADRVALVGVQSVSSIRTLEKVRDTLEREQGIHDQVLVLNRYEPAVPGFSAERIAQLLGVPAVSTVANDLSVMAAQNHAKPLLAAAPHSPVIADVRRLAARLSNATAPPVPEAGDRLQRILGKPSGPAPRRPLRVLHIEDDPLQQEVVALRLGAIEGFVVSIAPATSEAAAVALFSRQPFDFVLLDYHLAQGNGLGCLRQLRVLDANVPIVVISGVNQPQIAAELLSAGADDFLSKENLAGEQLGRSIAAAVARADAFKQRLSVPAPPEPSDTVVERLRATFAGEELAELMNSLVELRQVSHTGRFGAAQIQRLVDLVCAELGRTPGTDPPRRAILALFLRLFSERTE